MGATGFGARARQPRATEGLYAHYCADHVAVHVHVACKRVGERALPRVVEACLYAEREAIAVGADGGEQLRQFLCSVANDMQDRPEGFLAQIRDIREFDQRGCHVALSLKKPVG